MIAQSGLKIKDSFAEFDAKILFPVKKISSKEPAGCKCGMVLKGILKPDECGLLESPAGLTIRLGLAWYQARALVRHISNT